MVFMANSVLLMFFLFNVTNSESQVRLSKEEAKRLIMPLFSKKDGAICPGADICGTERLKLLEKRKNWDGIGCCTDCSCENDCTFYNDCCFPANATLHFEPDEECVRAVSIYTTVRKFPSPPAFYMITSCPMFPMDAMGMTDCWTFKNAAPWGPMFPVYSESTHRMYLNEKCAWCNNVFDGVFLNPSFSCPKIQQTNTDTLIKIYKGLRSDNTDCFVYFSEQNAPNRYLISKKRCFILLTIKRTCYGPATSEPVFNLSYQTVASLCKSDFFAPAFNAWGVFKNAFCMMCYLHSECNSRPSIGRDPALALDFTVLFDGVWVNTYTKSKEEDRQPLLACRVLPNKMLDTNDCRTVHCPNSQYRTSDGACVIPNATWSTDGLVLFLNLTPTEEIMISKEANFEIEKPLKHTWRVQRVFYTTKLKTNESHVVESIILEMSYGLSSKKLSVGKELLNDVLNDLKRCLYLQWKVSIFKRSFLCRLEFMPFLSTRLFELSVQKWIHVSNVVTFKNGSVEANVKNKVLNLVKQTGRILNDKYVQIGKHFLCNRISFCGKEITLSNDSLHLFIKQFDVHLQELSFFVWTLNSQDGMCAKVCIDDVPFGLLDNGKVKSINIVNKAVMCAYIVVMFIRLEF